MTDAPPPSKPAPKDPKAERLAKALRDNLRRRKVPPQASNPDQAGDGEP